MLGRQPILLGHLPPDELDDAQAFLGLFEKHLHAQYTNVDPLLRRPLLLLLGQRERLL